MARRHYYSTRTGKAPERRLDLVMLRKVFLSTYSVFHDQDYFQEALGKYCEEDGQILGTMRPDPAMYALIRLGRDGLFPISQEYPYAEEDIFDLIEFLYDHVSKPKNGHYHRFNHCGWHYDTFDKDSGQTEFRTAVNEILMSYGDGWELSIAGEILAKGESGTNALFLAGLPAHDERNVKARVEAAIDKFRRHRSSISDRKDAVRDLADVLEYLRPKAKEVLLSQDEQDLFNLANNFGIRHHNQKQKTDYDQAVWLSWLFYYYLATIHAALRLIERKSTS